MKTQPYFQTTINCVSIAERDERIADLQLRGFDVFELYENVSEVRQKQTGVTKRRDRKHYDGGLTRAVYSAVMRKPQ